MKWLIGIYVLIPYWTNSYRFCLSKYFTVECDLDLVFTTNCLVEGCLKISSGSLGIASTLVYFLALAL